MLKLPIKASQIANLTDARYFAAWEVNWMGFCLDPVADFFLQPMEVKAIREWVEGPKIVGEFGFLPGNEILELAEIMNLDGIQIGPLVNPEELAAKKGQEIFQELIIESSTQRKDLEAHLQKSSPFVDHFLLNFSKNNQPISQDTASGGIDLSQLQEWCEKFSILMDLPFSIQQVQQILSDTGAHGLSVSGGEEEKIGMKSYDELDEIFEALEIQI